MRHVVRVEGPQHGALCRAGRLRVVDRVNEQREPEDVGEEDEFLSVWGAGLAGRGQEVDAGAPLGCREPGLTREIVHVGDQAGEEEA